MLGGSFLPEWISGQRRPGEIEEEAGVDVSLEKILILFVLLLISLYNRADALGIYGSRFFNLPGSFEQLAGIEWQDLSIGNLFDAKVLDFNSIGIALVELDGEQSLKGPAFFVVVCQFGRDLAVYFMNQVVSPGDHSVFIPLRRIYFHGFLLGDQPS